MTEIVLFHHIQGLTPGVHAFADRFREAGHTVHVPDLYDGQTFASIDEGFAFTREVGGDEIDRRVETALLDLPETLVFAGISFGVMQAQRLAQTRRGSRAALLYEAFVSITGDGTFGPWPNGLTVQVHGMDDDEFFAHEGDLDAARKAVNVIGTDHAELFTYSGGTHLFVDSSLGGYDADATNLVMNRSLALLDRLG